MFRILFTLFVVSFSWNLLASHTLCLKIDLEILHGYGVKVPSLNALIDLNQSCGLNLEAVKERESIGRSYDIRSLTQSDPAVNILNLQALKKILDGESAVIHEENKKLKKIFQKMDEIKSESSSDSQELNKEGTQHLEMLLEIYNGIMNRKTARTGLKSPMFIKGEIEKLKAEILKVLAPFGLTKEHLDNLPY